MRKKFFAALMMLVLTLTACGGDDYVTVFDEVNTVEGVTMTLKQDTLRPSRATFIISNDSAEDVLLDPVEFHLEEKNKEGVWEENIGTRVSEWKRETTEVIPAGTSIEKKVDWKGLCGSIGSGEHRVILIINDQPVACAFER
ncbi:immunoglobulin-like domain-containing protein [Anaerotignum sp.]